MKRILLYSMLAICCTSIATEHPDKDRVQDGEQVNMRVMSFNVRSDIENQFSDGENSWVYRQDASPAMILDIIPDVCGMQEVRQHQQYSMESALKKYQFIGVGRDDGLGKGERMLIMYNKKTVKLLDWGTYWLSETPDIPSIGWDAAYKRTATWAKMRHIQSGKIFFFVNTHLDHRGKNAQKNGLALIVERIAAMNPDGFPMILTGDFNVLPTDSVLNALDGKMESAREKAEDTDRKDTFNGFGKGKGKILDYIYLAGFRGCCRFRVIDKTYENIPYISDHYPIYSDIIF
ncbi:MAG: endonuclease/exonuclease/phosphatase family protein [Bacteroidales bacterium]|nr:endonuclease/exonuclease/phosphatase family protein [Bacteroidales bacterium]